MTPTEHTTITKEEIAGAESRLLSAQLSGDTNALNELLYDNLIALSPAGQLMTKEMDLDSYRTGTVVLEEAVTEIENISIEGNTAAAVVLMEAKGSIAGNPLQGRFRYLRVWKRFADGLKIIAAAFTQLS